MDAVPAINAPAINADADTERVDLDGTSWIDITRGWITNADALYAHLESTVQWQQGKVWRYEKWIEEPRLSAGFKIETAPHPVLADAQHALEARYRAKFDGFGLAYYRNWRDSVAMHRDRTMTWLDDTVVAIITTGARRPFLVQRRNSRDRATARDLSPAGGDLMVFGGRFQADWLHGVPRAPQPVRGRISVQWRYTTKRGRRDTNPSYYEGRHFSKSRGGTR